MSSEWVLNQQFRIKVAFREVGADSGAIYPRLRFDFEFTNNSKVDVRLDFLYLDLSVRSKAGGPVHFLGRTQPSKPTELLASSIGYVLNFFLSLDYFGLSRLEKLREGGDLVMNVSVGLAAEVIQAVQAQAAPFGLGTQGVGPLGRQVSQFPVVFEFRIPKSDWVEQVLPQVGYSDVSLLEIPKLTDPNFADAIGYLNNAWKQYELGEYDKVLTECRKSLESIAKKIKDKGLSREIDGKTVPDWTRLLDNQTIGDSVTGIFQKTLGYLAPGAHAGGSRSREEAEFALMVTHSIANLVVKRISRTNQ